MHVCAMKHVKGDTLCICRVTQCTIYGKTYITFKFFLVNCVTCRDILINDPCRIERTDISCLDYKWIVEFNYDCVAYSFSSLQLTWKWCYRTGMRAWVVSSLSHILCVESSTQLFAKLTNTLNFLFTSPKPSSLCDITIFRYWRVGFWLSGWRVPATLFVYAARLWNLVRVVL